MRTVFFLGCKLGPLSPTFSLNQKKKASLQAQIACDEASCFIICFQYYSFRAASD